MKMIFKRVVSVILCLAMLTGVTVICDYNFIGSLKLIASATGDNYYMINGKTVNINSVNDTGVGKNEEFVKAMYNYVWDLSYTDDFASSDNIIKNVEYSERTLNADNLKKYVSRTQPGTILKVETISENEVSSENGFSVFIVSYDNNGFTVFERTSDRKETYYTWDSFCSIYQYSTIRFLKWPNSYFASSVSEKETDYKKPERILYYDSNEMLHGDDVRWVQQKLVDAGYSVSVDGYFGKKTETAVKLFQNDFSLTVTGIVDNLTSDMLENPKKKPAEIEIKIDSSSSTDLSKGDVLTVTWDKVEYAEGYHIFVYNSRGKIVDELDNVTTNKASFVLNDSGTYTVKGCAQNDVFVGNISSMESKVKVHNTYTVKFVDYDGTLLSKQSVAYGQDALTPASPKRTGFSFKGWDQDYHGVVSSLTITAQYVQKSFTVSFKDADGKNITEPQKVLYGNSAVEPDTSSIDGFIGWNKDFGAITSSCTITAVTVDKNSTLPFVISNTSAKREAESGGYTVNFTVTNTSDTKKVARAVVALKTTEGKFLTLTESSAFTCLSNGEKAQKVVVPYDKAATVVEIYIVENYNNLIPLSEVKKITEIVTEDNYSDWLPEEEVPETYYSIYTNPDTGLDYRTEYRYITRTTTSRSYSSLTGWTLDNITIKSWNYSGYGGWTRTKLTPTKQLLLDGKTYDVTQIDSKNVTFTSGYNLECWVTQSSYSPYYRHYWNYNHGRERYSYGQHYHSKQVSVDYFNNMGWVDIGAWYGGVRSNNYNYCGYNKAGVAGRTDGDGYIYYNTSTITEGYNLYRSQEKIPVYEYHFHKDSDWSDWSATEVKVGDTIGSNTTVVKVETRTTKRYEVNDPTVTNTGKTRTITGSVDSALAGKQATLFIYKIGEASDYTNEYIGQTIINEDGSYKFNFKLREEPTAETGDYTVTLGIEGSDSVIYLDSIKAPLSQYTVNIKDYDGSIIETQKVNKGESAVLPTTNPTRPGYTFAGWNYSNASIYEDTDIQALYVQDEYTVVFIDWANEKFVMQNGYHYGDALIVPDLNYIVGYDENGNITSDVSKFDGNGITTANDTYKALGWKGVTEGMTVTQNMVITAEFEKKTFTVNFYDYDKNIIDTQTVEYGDSAVAPTLESDENRMFISWDSCDYSCVTTSIDVEPIYCYTETAEKPTANIKSGVFDCAQTVTLSCSTEDSAIYYSLNGGEEVEYTSPLVIDNTSKLQFYACADGYNPSEVVDSYYVINIVGSEDTWKYPVNVYSVFNNKDVKFIETKIVDNNASLKDSVSNYSVEGYNVIGYYKDSALSNPYNIDNDTITASCAVYLKMEKAQYTVKFCKEDGSVIDEQTVEYLGNATAPSNVAVDDGYVFIGWETDDYLCVTNDLTVKAIIKNENDVANIKLNKTKLETISGMSYQLIATVTPEEYQNNSVVWTSSNNSVVSVDSTGKIKAVAPGTATITATLAGDYVRTATCDITVKSNNAEDITVVSGSTLKVSNGKLLGIKPDSNTVSEVFAELDSYSLEAYSSEGKKLGNDEKLETGATINLVDKNDNILDSVVVIVMGDVNGDGLVNVKDATLITRKSVYKSTIEGDAALAADVNGDGAVVNNDASIILEYLEGKKTVLS